jgi:hypothetical protein
MGLHVSVFPTVEITPDDDADFCAENTDFEGREAPLVTGAFYNGEERLVCHLSCPQYNNWREQLAIFAEYPKASPRYPNEGPWKHLISAQRQKTGPFSDSEGVLGPLACARLKLDFCNYYPRAIPFARSWGGGVGFEWLTIYENFKDAFCSVSNGAVVFT